MYCLFLGFSNACFQVDIDYVGNDIRAIRNVNSLYECKHHCDQESTCFAFTYVDDPNHHNHKMCFLKNAKANNPTPNQSVVSGQKSCFKSGKSYCKV